MKTERPSLTLLRVKRKRSGRIPDVVQVRVAKRQRLSTALQSLALTTVPSKEAPKDAAAATRTATETCDNKGGCEDSPCIVFRRLLFSDGVVDASTPAYKTTVLDSLKGSRKDIRVVDVAEALLQRLPPAMPSKDGGHMSAHTSEPLDEAPPAMDENSVVGVEQDQYDVFAREDIALEAFPFGVRPRMVGLSGTTPSMADEINEDAVAFVDGASIFEDGFLDGGMDESDEDIDLSDYDAQTVDYPSTPDDTSGEDSSSDGADYERYERYGDSVEYDSEC